jgi:signal transduction histidine kinase
MAAEAPTSERYDLAQEAERTEFVRQIEELREAVRARDSFLDIAAHELRNPMGALLLQVERTLETARRADDANLIRQIERTEHAVKRYVKRATALLDNSRVNAGKLQLECKPVDFAQVVREIADSYVAEAEYFRTPIGVSIPDRLLILSDRLTLEQITGNLISNAIKYGAGAPVQVTLESEREAACLTVADQGIGISDEDQGRIFQRFERLFANQQRGGFGIGLWLVRQLVDALGGEIAVTSTPGQGSTFTITLPVGAASSEPKES